MYTDSRGNKLRVSSPHSSFLSALISPAAGFALAVLGYYAFGGLVTKFFPDGSVGSVLSRALIVSVITIAFSLSWKAVGQNFSFLYPFIIFSLLYIARLGQNVFLLGIEIKPGNGVVFGFFLVSGVFSALLLARTYREMRDDHLAVAVSVLCVIFLVGLILNRQQLNIVGGARLSIEKINPIAMGHTAFGFIIYYVLSFGRSRRLTVEAAIFIPILLFVAVWARSRGAYLAGAGSLILYVLLLEGRRRLLTILGAAVVIGLLLSAFGTQYLDVVLERLAKIDPETDSSTLSRSLLLSGAWQQFLDDFAFGRFAVEMHSNYYPHNIYVESLMALGLLGSLPFIIHCLLAIRAAIGVIRSKRFPLIAVFAAVLFIKEAIGSAGSGSLWGNSAFWITSVMVITFWYGSKRERRSRSIKPISQQGARTLFE
ncbi:O-antigen ligase family protein [Mesorhizobium sp. M0965]|uniref:O-antigen ligase family protein n=1 Tax=Mesorhizobium sp. M0965 TaxID=2957036 RepID=UPI00333D532A